MGEKGIIIDVEKHSVTVLTEDNGYYKLARKPTMYVSQEIHFKKSDIINTAYIIKRVSLAAAIVFIIGISIFASIMFNKSTYNDKILAYVSLDINPSIQLAVDKDYKVMDADYINKDAMELMADLDPKGMKISEAFYIIINRCAEKGIVKEDSKNYYLISGAIKSNKNLDEDVVKTNQNKLNSLLQSLRINVMSMYGKNNEVDTFQLDRNDIDAAKKSGISLGRYALYKEIVKTGSKISLNDAKNFEVSDLIITYQKNRSDIAYSSPTAGNGKETATNSQSTNSQATDIVGTPFPSGLESSPISSNTPKILNTHNSLNTRSILNTPTKGSNNYSSSNSSSIKPSVDIPKSAATATPKPETGTGLMAEYYDNIDLTKLVTTQVDKHINFFWFSGMEPAPGVKRDDSYSVRWTGYIKPPYTGEYKFYVNRDNGVRLWINNELVIDKWNEQYNVIDTGKIILVGNKKYDIKVEFYNNTGNGIISLWWTSILVEKSVVPQSCLYPAAKPPEQTVLPGDGNGLSYEYYDNTDLTVLKAKGIDKEINFNWGTGSPDQRVHQDQQYSIRWTGYVEPLYDESYKFHIDYDGGVRLWIDNKLEINEWGNSGKYSTATREIKLKAGSKHKIKVEYFNGNMYGRVKLMWSSPSIKKSVIPMTRLFSEE